MFYKHRTNHSILAVIQRTLATVTCAPVDEKGNFNLSNRFRRVEVPAAEFRRDYAIQ